MRKEISGEKGEYEDLENAKTVEMEQINNVYSYGREQVIT